MKFLTITLGFFLAASTALGGTSFFGPPVSGTATTTSTQILPQNNLRAYFIIVNTGSSTIYIKFGASQAASEGIPIPASGNYEPYQVPLNSVWVETASSTSTYTLIQGQ